MVWTREVSQRRERWPKHNPEERHHSWGRTRRAVPLFIWADLRKLYCVYSHHAEVCQPDGKSSTHKDGRGRKSELVHLLEIMKKWVMIAPPELTSSLSVCLLRDVTTHPACILSPSLTCDIKKIHMRSLETHTNVKYSWHRWAVLYAALVTLKKTL